MHQDPYKLYIEGECHLANVVKTMVSLLPGETIEKSCSSKNDPLRSAKYLFDESLKLLSECVNAYILRRERLQRLNPDVIFLEMGEVEAFKIKECLEKITKITKDQQKSFLERWYKTEELYDPYNLIKIYINLDKSGHSLEDYMAAFNPEMLWAVYNRKIIIGIDDYHLRRKHVEAIKNGDEDQSEELTQKRDEHMAKKISGYLKRFKPKVSYSIVGEDHIRGLLRNLWDEAWQLGISIDYEVYDTKRLYLETL